MRAIRGKRGQTFLKSLALELDAMPEKRLVTEELITSTGECCTIGVVCKARNIDVSNIDITDTKEVGDLVGISAALAGEIEYVNDCYDSDMETPESRWERMRKWVGEQIMETKS